jgi:hypothetical protein
MASGKRRITLDGSRIGFWSRLFRRDRGDRIAGEIVPLGVDVSLRRRAAVRAVRAFIETIDTYQLHTRRTVHVVSRYRLPSDTGLQTRVPEWIAERVRFGVVGADGEYQYLGIRQVDVAWDDDGTELYLHLEGRVAPGTRAFIAAYLGDEDPGERSAVSASPRLLGGPS